MDTLFVAPYETANPVKGNYPDGFADGVSITVVENPGLKGYTHRLVRSAGAPWPIGEKIRIRHDQTRRDLGTFTVVGHVVPDTGETAGVVPNHRLPLWSVK